MAAAAASSPSTAPSNNSSDATVSNAAVGPAMLRMETPSKTLRGLNKPKCIQCGNVARSRCPYKCCKGCCFKAQNPCHIHVLKLPPAPIEKPPSTPVAEQQQPAEPPPPVVSHRPSPRQPLQANAYKLLYAATRSRKPLTRKEAAAINEWRFSKLREYNEKNIEMENDAFHRYMKNVNSLEEVFSTTSDLEVSTEEGLADLEVSTEEGLADLEVSTEEGLASSSPAHTSTENDTKIVSRQKWKLRSNPLRSENVRNKVKQIVDDGLMKLKKFEYVANVSDEEDQNEGEENRKRAKTLPAERSSVVNNLIDKLNRARNEDDLKSCLERKVQLYGQRASSSIAENKDGTPSDEASAALNSGPRDGLDLRSQKSLATLQIDQEALNNINVHFCSLEKIGSL